MDECAGAIALRTRFIVMLRHNRGLGSIWEFPEFWPIKAGFMGMFSNQPANLSEISPELAFFPCQVFNGSLVRSRRQLSVAAVDFL